LLLILRSISLLLRTRRSATQQHEPNSAYRNVFQVVHGFRYGTTIVSPAFSKISCSGFLPPITSL
jgi:hypothetical protein